MSVQPSELRIHRLWQCSGPIQNFDFNHDRVSCLRSSVPSGSNQNRTAVEPTADRQRGVD
ncbi:MAG TPA: hypothetical protein DDZ51_18285 [Planctomycetaceae bacterium]|nr:hypothetical protein [Planctomycetaceae bacterium]